MDCGCCSTKTHQGKEKPRKSGPWNPISPAAWCRSLTCALLPRHQRRQRRRLRRRDGAHRALPQRQVHHRPRRPAPLSLSDYQSDHVDLANGPLVRAGCHAFAAVHGHVAIPGFARSESMLCTPNVLPFSKSAAALHAAESGGRRERTVYLGAYPLPFTDKPGLQIPFVPQLTKL